MICQPCKLAQKHAGRSATVQIKAIQTTLWLLHAGRLKRGCSSAPHWLETEGIELTRKRNPYASMALYGNRLVLLILCMQLLMANVAAASSLAIGEGYMNQGGTKDVYSLPDKNSDILAALAVGAPCDILSVSGDWVEIRMYTEILGFFTGWVTADNIVKAGAGDPVLPEDDSAVLITPTPVAATPSKTDEKTSAPQATPPSGTAQWTSPQPGYTAYCSAVVKNPNGQRLHLRSAPSTQAASLGLYYTGAEAVCYSDPSQEWVYVSVGNRFGYMKTEFLYFGDSPESVPPQTPIAYVTNQSQYAWLNLRSQPSTQAEVLGKYANGDRVTVIGKVDDWYHVKANDTYGFMLSDYLALTDMAPSAQAGTLRQYSTTQYILRGYTLEASMTETQKNSFDVWVQLVLDPSVKLNSYPCGFHLYINGKMACSIGTAQNAAVVSIPTQFSGRVAFAYDISLIQLVPIDSDGSENFDEAVYLR